ncbi:hypothetical protein [Actinoplanes solisilvae]|uniref:hypothetical protein n=1 Tax=Actinoplanes solisilvae TaxID=2486853 RepID=UPI000FDCA02E|nr:hypothetical protein [Actinoplanes solisilvae]
MDYQVSVNCEQLAEWYMRIKGLADAHHGQPTADRLKALADEIYAQVPSEWWATQPQPLDNRVRK